MKATLILCLISVTCFSVCAEETPQFKSPLAQRARTSYDKQVNDAVVRYYRDLQAAQKNAMDARDLNEANLIQAELVHLKGRLVESSIGDKHNVTVQASDVDASPRATGIKLRKGQRFTLEPNEQDKWTGGGSKKGVLCDFMGYGDRKTNWMHMMWKVGKAKGEPVVKGKTLEATEDGELFLFATDGDAGGNEGRIRVNIIVSPQ